MTTKSLIPRKGCEIQVLNIFGNKVLKIRNALTPRSIKNLVKATEDAEVHPFLQSELDKGVHYDGRWVDNSLISEEFNNFIKYNIKKHYGEEVKPSYTTNVNYYRTLNAVKAEGMVGNYPHIDPKDSSIEKEFAVLLFLNVNNSHTNGTRFYLHKSNIPLVRTAEEHYITLRKERGPYKYAIERDTISALFKESIFIPAELNTMLIYDGRVIHGAAHNNIEFIDKYRKTMVIFYDLV